MLLFIYRRAWLMGAIKKQAMASKDVRPAEIVRAAWRGRGRAVLIRRSLHAPDPSPRQTLHGHSQPSPPPPPVPTPDVLHLADTRVKPHPFFIHRTHGIFQFNLLDYSRS